MSFILHPIDTVDQISPADFKKNYLDARRPLVIKGLTNNWAARQKWTPEYLKQVVGSKVVPLYDNSKADPSKPINAKAAKPSATNATSSMFASLLRRLLTLTRVSIRLRIGRPDVRIP